MIIEHGIKYNSPLVYLINESGLGTSELAARTCYDSFDLSENPEISKVAEILKGSPDPLSDEANDYLCDCNNIEDSKLLHDLSWTYFHHSVIEHSNLTFLIKGTSRGVLQEHARHRIQSISVRSTRYTLSDVINSFVCSLTSLGNSLEFFTRKMLSFDLLVTSDEDYNKIEIQGIYNKLMYQYKELGQKEFLNKSLTKENIETFKSMENTAEPDKLFSILSNTKKKRNVGDSFKHIITDNFKVDMVVTMNLRALRNYLKLRDSGAAYFQIRWLAKAMKKVIPQKYLKLIDKEYK